MVGTLKIKGKNNESRLIFVYISGTICVSFCGGCKNPGIGPVLSAKEKMVFRRASGDGSG